MEENKVAQITKHTDSSRSTDSDSSTPNSPELTRLSGEQAEERTAREGRAREWMKTQPRCVGYHEDGSPSCDGADLVGYDHAPHCPLAGRKDLRERSTLTTPGLLAAYAESECSRLASRVEELENLIAKHSLSPELSTTQLDTESEKK